MSDQAKDDHPDIIMLPPLIALIALLGAVALEWIAGISFLPAPGSTWALVAGLLLIAGSIALAGWSVRTFQQAGTNLSPHMPTLTIATIGPYRFSRNPIYLSFVVLLVGVSLVFALEWGLNLAPVLLLALHYGVVLPEERYLTGKFGEDYANYTVRTRRWL